MRCFNGNLTNDAFKAHQQQMREEVASLTAGKMDNTDRDAWVDYYCSKYEIECLTIYPDSAEFDLGEKKIQVYNQWSRMVPYEPEYYEVSGFRATCKVAYTGDPVLFELTPMMHTLNAFEADRVVRPDKDGVGYLVLGYEVA